MSTRTFEPELHPGAGKGGGDVADRSERRTYVFDEDIVLAVNVALATARPILIFGPPGSGKSSLARDIATELGWRYYKQVVTSRTEAADLLWRIDLVRRLADAQARDLAEEQAYRAPGVLWWAFRPSDAKQMGARASELGGHVPDQSGERAVVLVDEIDKADPDLPNNLLVPLGEWRFQGPDGPVEAEAGRWPLLVITSNNERDLPQAFLRRCVILNLPRPTADHLVSVAVAHLGDRDDDLYEKAATLVTQRADVPGARAPSTAEYLDFVRACIELELVPDSDEWRRVERATLAKEPDPEGRRVG